MKGPLTEEYLLHIGKASKLSSILSLNLSNHCLDYVDVELFSGLTSLTSLDLSQNNLTEMPDQLTMPNIRVLDCCDNNLTSLNFVKHFKKLEQLYTDGNKELKMDDSYIAKMFCPTLSCIDGDLEHILAGIDLYTSQLQPQITAVWEARFAEVYHNGVVKEEVESLHKEFVGTINKTDLIGANLTMPKLKQFLIDDLCRKLLVSINKGTYSTDQRTKLCNNTPSKYGTRTSSGTRPLKDYSSGAPVDKEDKTTAPTKFESDCRQPTSKRKRTDTPTRSPDTPTGSPTKSPNAKRRKQCNKDYNYTKLKTSKDCQKAHLPPVDEYDPSLFLRCHSKGNNPADEQTKVWKCAFEPEVGNSEETTNVLATCGGKIVCFIDCQTGKVMRRYKDNSKTESFYCLAWTTLRADGENLKEDVNILAVAGQDGEIKLIHPTQLLMFGILQGHRGYVSSLQFHPTQPDLLFSGSRDNRIIMWQIGIPNFSDCSIKCSKKAMFSLPKTDAISLVVNPLLDILIAGCEQSCYGWRLDKLKQDVNIGPHYEFIHPSTEADRVTVDGLVILPNNCIVSKCVADSCMYVWDMSAHIGSLTGKINSVSKMRKIVLRPLAKLQYSCVDVDYLYPDSNKGVLCVGDDKGNVHMYNLATVVNKKMVSDELLLASAILSYPEISIEKTYEVSMTDVKETDSEDVVVNCVALSSSGEFLVYGTDNNLVCIWKKH